MPAAMAFLPEYDPEPARCFQRMLVDGGSTDYYVQYSIGGLCCRKTGLLKENG
jgi:hypothetical protein